jgi:hypothetical protein
MPAQPNLKSTAVTNWDATPPVRPTAGQGGGQSILYDITDKVGPTTDGDTTGGVLRLCRIPSNAIIKQVLLTQVAATTTATFDVGIDYSDDPNDIAANQHFVAGTALNDDIFAAGYDSHASPAAGWVDVTFLNSDYTPAETIQPIWKAAGTGLTSDPQCMMDIVLTNRSTISGAATVMVRVLFTIAGQ